MTAKFLRIFLVYIVFIVEIKGFSEKLSGESIIYGLASLTENYEKHNWTKCWESLHVFYKGVEDRHVWALKVMDASGQAPTGFLYGNNLWIGSHFHCMDIPNRKPLEINHEKVKHSAPTPFDFPPFPLKFVKAVLKHNSTLQLHTQLPFDFTIKVGLCVPKQCSDSDLFLLFEKYLSTNQLNAQNIFNLELNIEKVSTLEEDASFLMIQPKFILLATLLSVILILSLFGTIYDVTKHYKEKNYILKLRQNMGGKMGKTVSEVELVSRSNESINSEESIFCEVLRCFSLYSNAKALVNTNLSADSIKCIHGIRFLGMVWVCIIHSIFYQVDYLTDPPYGYRLSEDFANQLLSNSTYSVDTYLFISGFLLAFLYYKSKHSSDSSEINYVKKLMEFVMMCFHRFIRLTPVYLTVILLCDVIYTYLREVSSLESSEAPDVTCHQYWWRNILYINNLYPRKEMCLSWSWYLSMDTQAFVVAAALLIISSFAFKTAMVSLVFLVLGSIVATTYKSYSIGYIPTMDEQLVHLDDIYDLPWNRIGPYMVGVVTAHLLVVRLQYKLLLGKIMRAICWILFPSLNLCIIFILYTRQLTVEFSAVYMGLSRTLWGVGLAWILIACCTDNGGMINKFLSFPGWIPLSRLTFSAYLLNPLVANFLYLKSESTYNSSTAGFAVATMAVTLVTFILSFVLSILFESPFILLTKVLLKRKLPKSSKNEVTRTKT